MVFRALFLLFGLKKMWCRLCRLCRLFRINFYCIKIYRKKFTQNGDTADTADTFLIFSKKDRIFGEIRSFLLCFFTVAILFPHKIFHFYAFRTLLLPAF